MRRKHASSVVRSTLHRSAPQTRREWLTSNKQALASLSRSPSRSRPRNAAPSPIRDLEAPQGGSRGKVKGTTARYTPKSPQGPQLRPPVRPIQHSRPISQDPATFQKKTSVFGTTVSTHPLHPHWQSQHPRRTPRRRPLDPPTSSPNPISVPQHERHRQKERRT
ncbi:hypothetical protein DFP72DRAFT_1064157 [Ephemerocybe angulata]|uniref:Uncharacterized protein n=1 Tax=Ephemerocybe angulata TaxID=980116 RepID=A0A8H6I5A7_9AGAR|nr:hypothetical protein DFP72DRAFT_1064157 [Tulosesus angulatus]